ncbi:hypothetical protein TMatcc_002361 [Talaromyces marneffei ATCC 18224]|uniref:C6 transcription factor, putative n=2 Tax=Talaromyces marneffei TaxID=37727 RepID=B6QJL5_TALMQ|nr:C6 transcription factor, putative [Talaromyces marneffei ATCC 18224]
MSYSEPAPKRRRITESNSLSMHPQDLPGYSPESAEPFHSPLSSSNSRYYQDGFSHNPGYIASQEELRSMLIMTAQSAAPSRRGSPLNGEEIEPETIRLQAGSGVDSRWGARAFSQGNEEIRHYHQRSTDLSVLGSVQGKAEGQTMSGWNRRRIQYLKNYVAEVAPWLDMFDSQATFGIQLPNLARNFPGLLYAILAISARQMERKEGIPDSFESLELYQEAIRLLSPLLQDRDPKVIGACVVLCCLEMMSARAQDWRRHLEGCAALFDAFSINGFSQGLLQAIFWCYARMDLCGALMSDGTQGTLLQPSKWLPANTREEDVTRMFRDAKSPDMYANYAVYLCAKACEIVSLRTKFLELGEDNGCTGEIYHQRWLKLWEELQNWLAYRPRELLPVQTVNSKPFPHILFVHWAAISSNQLYHTACVLMLNMKPKGLKLRANPEVTTPLWHARRICGISVTNPHAGCLNNAIQPLWIAGRLFSHQSEHAQIISLIRSIEAATGWGACWRIRDLEIAWGYKAHRMDRPEKQVEESLTTH